MFQVRKSRSYEISAIFLHCCLIIETQVLITVSNFLRFFSRNHFLEGGLHFSIEVFVFQMEEEGGVDF